MRVRSLGFETDPSNLVSARSFVVEWSGKIPLCPPLEKGDFAEPPFGKGEPPGIPLSKEGRGEIFKAGAPKTPAKLHRLFKH